MEQSYWYSELKQRYPALDRNLSVDTAIIGGGVAGMSAAYELTRRGQSVCVLEAALVGSGQTGRASANVSFAHDLIYDRLIKKFGKTRAKAYLDLNAEGLRTVLEIIAENGIDCGLMRADLYFYTCTQKGAKKLEREHRAYAELGRATELTERTELPFPVERALRVPDQACFNPYRYLAGLSEAVSKNGGHIFERTHVTTQPEDGTLAVGGHTVRARRFIVATHYPYLNVPGFYFTKLSQSRGHNVVFRTELKLNNIYEEAEAHGFEYRPVRDGVLCNGANVRTGKYKDKNGYHTVEESFRARIPGESEALCRFSAQDCMTYDMLPLVGEYGTLSGVYVVTGFNKWGFTTSAICAKILADLCEGKEAHPLFDSRRAYFTKALLVAAKNMGEVAADYAALLSTSGKRVSRIRPGEAAVVRHGGHRLGVYRDEAGSLHVVSGVCPHLGCALKWNPAERSWDCPCHGSRFDADGNLLDNPALTGAKSREDGHD